MHDQDRRWTLLRDTGSGGAPSDDPDLTDPANAAAVAALAFQSVPARHEGAKLVFFAVAYNASGVALARGTATLELVVYQQLVRLTDFKDPTLPTCVISSDPVATTLQEKVVIDAGAIDRFMVGIQTQANMPGGTDRVRIFWRIE